MVFNGIMILLTLPAALGVVSGWVGRPWPSDTRPGVVLQGGLFGSGAVLVFLQPLDPNFVADVLSTLIGLGALFFGPLAAAVSGGMAIAGGIWLGKGAPVWQWLTVLAPAGIGLLAHFRFRPAVRPLSLPFLYGFGLAVRLVTLVPVFAAGGDIRSPALADIGLDLVLLCPLATVFAGKILGGQTAVHKGHREPKQAGQVASGREVFFNKLIDSISVPIFYKDRDGRYQGFNRAFEEFFGTSREELVGKTVFETHPPELARLYWTKDTQLFESGGVQRYEARVKNAHGRLRDVFFDKTVFRDEEGAPAGLIGAVLDITDRKQMEKELQESNDLLRAIIDAAPTAIIGLDLDGNVRSVWNPAAEKMLGWSAGEAMGRPLPSVPEQGQEEFKGFRERIRSGRTLNGVEVRRRRRDGTPIEYSIYASPLHDADSRITGNIAVLVDITERKRSERALAASEAKMRSILDNVGIGVALISPEMEILELNRRMRQWFPAIDPARRPTCYRAFNDPPRDRVCGYCPTCKTLKDGRVHEATSETPQGDRIRNYRILSSPILDESGKVIAAVEMVDDITERLSLEAQLLQAQKMESVGRLAGGVAHDFNNMLAVIMGHVDMALQTAAPAGNLLSHLQAIRKTASRSADLTRQLLAFARKQTVVPVALDLNETIQGMIKMLSRLIGEDIELDWRPAPEVLAVEMDPTQVDQILANLCVNARDAIAGIGRITIETGRVAFREEDSARLPDILPGDFVTLVVRDNGHGMDQKTLDNIFEPFFTTKEPGKGTGLGLATVYGIVKQNDGFIKVDSEPGRGSSFRIYLPRHEAALLAAQSESREVPLARDHETILLVEDEAAILEITRLMLEELQYRVLWAATPGEAIRAAEAHADKIDLVLTDVVMPEMNGRDLAERLRAVCPGVKCLFMSGYTSDILAPHGVLEAGIEYIQKPFSVQSLAGRVRQTLDGN
jgi:two-component system cell cycle sensor histidine kinase/response regulator CckA